MGITVVGNWELGWNAPIKEVELWNFVLREFNVTDWWMWPVSGVRNSEEQQGVHLEERADLSTILSEVTGPRVFVEPRNTTFPQTLDSTWLHDFAHPDDAVYIFGSVYHNPVVSHWQEGELKVTLKTERDDGVPWPHQILLALLYDRMVKAWP